MVHPTQSHFAGTEHYALGGDANPGNAGDILIPMEYKASHPRSRVTTLVQ
jgi:hypothetical protein